MAETTSSEHVPLPSDLESVRVVAHKLLIHLSKLVNRWHIAAVRALTLSELSGTNQETEVTDLDQLIVETDNELAAVKDARAKLGSVREDLLDLIEFAGAVSDFVKKLPQTTNGLNDVIRTLNGYQLKVSRFLGGPDSGIDYSIREVGRRWARAATRGRRKPGRPRNSLKARVGALARTLRKKRLPWKQVAQEVNREMGCTYEVNTIEKYAREENGG